jgi:protein TonB
VRERTASAAGVGLSAAVHLAVFASLWLSPPPRPRGETVTVEIEEVVRPPPPAPEEPPPEPVRAPARPRAVPVPREAPPAPAAGPPPPAEAPPPGAPPPGKRAPIRIGVPLSGTAEAGGVAVPVGNTLYGRAPAVAPDPAEVKPYGAERYAPPTRVAALPRLLSCDVPRSAYPDEARQAGLEGTVRLSIVVGADGKVLGGKVLADPGRGLGAAALPIVQRWCRFAPATLDGQPVATEVPFELPFTLR